MADKCPVSNKRAGFGVLRDRDDNLAECNFIYRFWVVLYSLYKTTSNGWKDIFSMKDNQIEHKFSRFSYIRQ